MAKVYWQLSINENGEVKTRRKFNLSKRGPQINAHDLYLIFNGTVPSFHYFAGYKCS
jgi:hypothetical protein